MPSEWITDRPPQGDCKVWVHAKNGGGLIDVKSSFVRDDLWGKGDKRPWHPYLMPEPYVPPKPKDAFDEQEFYELMQAYRWGERKPTVDDQQHTEKAFQAVIAFIREQVDVEDMRRRMDDVARELTHKAMAFDMSGDCFDCKPDVLLALADKLKTSEGA